MRSHKQAIARTFFLVFDRGDEVIAALRAFAEKEQIHGGSFVAIGACERATIAWWNWTSKEYEKRALDEQLEVLSLAGDITVEDGRVKIHAHVSLGRSDGSAIGGHLIEAIVRPTLEMQLLAYENALTRRTEEETKLALIEGGDRTS